MGNGDILIKNLIGGLSSGKLTVEDIDNIINNSSINPLYKKGLKRIQDKVGNSNFKSKIINLGDSVHKRVALFEKVSKDQYIKDMLGHNLISIDNKEVLDWYEDILHYL